MPMILEVQPPIRLRIGATETVLSISVPQGANATLVMPIGTVTTRRAYFRHDPPAALEIEHAIEAVEDALARIYPALPASSALQSADPLVRRIAQLTGAGPGRELVLGRDQDAIPTDPEFAAALLILRECMHHLQFESIAVALETE